MTAEAAGRIRCPVLVITGAKETQLADVRAVTAPGGHFIPEEAPAALAAELSGFLASRL